MSWIWLALLSAFAAGVVATLAKAGLEKVDSNVGFALQSVVILLVSWLVIVFQGKTGQIRELTSREFGIMVAIGAISAVGYLFYYASIKAGPASQAAPVDRLSLVFAIVFAACFLKEKITPQIIVGALFMALGAILIALVKTE